MLHNQPDNLTALFLVFVGLALYNIINLIRQSSIKEDLIVNLIILVGLAYSEHLDNFFRLLCIILVLSSLLLFFKDIKTFKNSYVKTCHIINKSLIIILYLYFSYILFGRVNKVLSILTLLVMIYLFFIGRSGMIKKANNSDVQNFEDEDF